jgi:putative membrane-bound dehydrogenase-like protein
MTRVASAVVILGTCCAGLPAADPPRTGPQTEKRFPPLKVPAGFKATLFACDPLIEYPSVISIGPRPGAIFVGIDYMTGLGTDIVRRSEVRLVEDTDGDGYADKATVFAKDFNSIQGLAYHDGTVYVMHAPFLTALREKDGKVERRDLLTGLGLTPEQNPVRLHCANGVVVGHDGWLYLAMGDHGVDVTRPEGDRLVLRGGGILRCRPDGRDLHVFATGLRNIYDVGLDAELNVFVRDNENDGGTYMIRVCHSFFGADHGYPYLYEERPNEALRPIADLGLGSSAGVVCYLERQFPPEYRGNLFCCEWGRSVVRYRLWRAGSTFDEPKEIEFAAGAADDPYGFKPTDLVVQRDGTLMVSDYADGQRPKRGRGRIYHIQYVDAKRKPDSPVSGTGVERWLVQLDSESLYDRWEAQTALERSGRDGVKALTDAIAKERIGPRGRLHAVWLLVHVDGAAAIDELMRIAKSDREPSVRAQAVRAIADLVDPVLVRHKLDAGRGDTDIAERLAALAKGQDRPVVLEIVIALGRLRWESAPLWLCQNIKEPDGAAAHAAMQTMRHSGDWSSVLRRLDDQPRGAMQDVALRALADQFEPTVVDDLIKRLSTDRHWELQRQDADLLARVYKKPGPWVYWGYRPAPRPANTLAWEKTEAIAAALDQTLANPNRKLRLAVLGRMQREKVPVRLATLGKWLEDEHDTDRVAAILVSLGDYPAADVRGHVEKVVRDALHSVANRRTALTLFIRGHGTMAAEPLLALAQGLEDGPVLADVLGKLRNDPNVPAVPLLVAKLRSRQPVVRAAAMEAIGERRAVEGRGRVIGLLQDKDANVRRAAAAAAGKLGAVSATEQLLKVLKDDDPLVRCASLDSLRLLRERRALPLAVAALNDRALELKALEYLGELGGPEQTGAVADVAKRNPSADLSSAAVRVLNAWRNRDGVEPAKRQELDSAVAEVHGSNGILVRWQADGGAWPASAPANAVEPFGRIGSTPFPEERTLFATGTEGRVVLAPKSGPKDARLAYTEVIVTEPTAVEFLASSSGPLQIWLNGKSLHRREQAQPFRIDSDRFAGSLDKGANRLLVMVGPSAGPVEFHLRFRRKSSKVEHERLTQAALTRGGNVERGRKVFFDMEKSQCLKCHRVGDKGERIGPELTGVGGRFSRIHLVESILEPSRTIAASFETQVITLKSGKVLTGVKVAETETTLTIADKEGQKQTLMKGDIDRQETSPVSTMPDGLEKRFTEDEFVDLIAFLVSQKEGRGP